MEEMDIRLCVVAPCARVISQLDEIEFDLHNFVLRLLLFDKYILQSIRLLEFSYLLDLLGFDVVNHLVTENIITVQCDALAIGSIGQQSSWLRQNKPALPLGSYAFRAVKIFNEQNYIHNSLQNLHKAKTVHRKKIIRFKSTFAPKLKTYPDKIVNEYNIQFDNDIKINSPVIKMALAKELEKKLKIKIPSDKIMLRFEQIDDDAYKSISNIRKLFNLSEKENHLIIEASLLAIAHLNRRLADMKLYNAISGCSEGDLDIFQEKYNFLESQFSAKNQVERFERVLSIKDFPDLKSAIIQKKVDFEKILDLRERKECKEFRRWLWSIDKFDDDELAQHLKSFKAQLGNLVSGEVGKTVRWIATTGIGAIPVIGPILSVPISAIDTFLVEKLFPKSGAIAFINNLFPSIFRES